MTDITVSPALTSFFEEIKQPTQERTAPVEPAQEKIAIETPAPAPVVLDKKLIESSSEIAIGLIDGVQETIFSLLANYKKRKKANEIDEEDNGVVSMQKAIAKNKKNIANPNIETVLTEKELQLLELNEVVNTFIAELGFTEKQSKSLIEPIKYIIEKNGGKIPMELFLFVGLTNAIGANAAALIAI